MGRITGKKIVLREFRWEDLGDIRTWVTDGNVGGMLGDAFKKPQTWEQTETYLRNLLDGGAGANFVIAEKESLAYLGQVNLNMVDTIARKAELGIVLPEKNTRKGYGYEAGTLALKFAFEEMNLNRIHLKVYADNLRAIRLYEKLGFKHEGRLREDNYRAGKYEDTLVMGILRSEWQAEA